MATSTLTFFSKKKIYKKVEIYYKKRKRNYKFKYINGYFLHI